MDKKIIDQFQRVRLDHALDAIATTNAGDPESGVRSDFLKSGNDYLTIQPPGISIGAFEVPVALIGIESLDARWFYVRGRRISPEDSRYASVRSLLGFDSVEPSTEASDGDLGKSAHCIPSDVQLQLSSRLQQSPRRQVHRRKRGTSPVP